MTSNQQILEKLQKLRLQLEEKKAEQKKPSLLKNKLKSLSALATAQSMEFSAKVNRGFKATVNWAKKAISSYKELENSKQEQEVEQLDVGVIEDTEEILNQTNPLENSINPDSENVSKEEAIEQNIKDIIDDALEEELKLENPKLNMQPKVWDCGEGRLFMVVFPSGNKMFLDENGIIKPEKIKEHPKSTNSPDLSLNLSKEHDESQEFEEKVQLNQNLFWVKNKGTCGFMDKNGNWITPVQFDYIQILIKTLKLFDGGIDTLKKIIRENYASKD